MPNGTPVIPEYIVVHLGTADSDAANIRVPFVDYIKNVASSELYPTWPENALRANIYAQISFALNRVFTEYYRARGYDFDITSTTAGDQRYVEGRDIFANVGTVVEEIFDSYIRRVDNIEPLFASYCNGTTTTCSGLSQWGSVSLANEGLTPIDILRNYYGDDIELVVNVPVIGMELSAPEVPLRIGSVGEDVALVQNRLGRISTNYPNIPKIPEIDGIFDLPTEQAVVEFQRTFGLTPDGVVGKVTWYELLRVYNAVKRLNELDSEGLTYEEFFRQYPGELRPGDTGNEVKVEQYYLQYIAQYDPTVPAPEISGVYDEATEAAVRAFQEEYGLPPTGIIDRDTFDKLYGAYRGIIASLPPELFENGARPFPGTALVIGSEGEDVRDFQTYLYALRNVYPILPDFTVNGIYDEATEAAVRVFQDLFDIPGEGVVGVVTWTTVAEQYDDLRASNTRQSGQFPGETITTDSATFAAGEESRT